MKRYKKDRTVSVGLHTLFSGLTHKLSSIPNAPRGTNAGWVVKDDLRKIVAANPELKSFVEGE
jgi:hypothetical protein